jgi:hypothetical protein
MLGLAELDCLSGRKKKAEATALRALKLAETYKFGLETGYAKKLIKTINVGKGFPLNLP